MLNTSAEQPNAQRPLVTVVIPAYNSEQYIEKAVRSALDQTLYDIEVLVIDDGSTDGTKNVLSSINDDRLTILVNPKNLGVSSSRNRGFEAARGTWIAILDSDDWFAPERLEKLIEAATQNKADVVADDLNLVKYGDTSAWSTLVTQHGNRLVTPMVLEPVSFVATDQYGRRGLKLGWIKPMFKREFLSKHSLQYDTYIEGTEDFWFYLRCLISGAQFIIIPDALYYLYSRPGSLVTSSQVKRLGHNLRATDEIQSLPSVRENRALVAALQVNKSRYQHYHDYFTVVEAIKAKRWFAALKAIIRRPLFLRVKLNQIVDR